MGVEICIAFIFRHVWVMTSWFSLSHLGTYPLPTYLLLALQHWTRRDGRPWAERGWTRWLPCFMRLLIWQRMTSRASCSWDPPQLSWWVDSEHVEQWNVECPNHLVMKWTLIKHTHTHTHMLNVEKLNVSLSEKFIIPPLVPPLDELSGICPPSPQSRCHRPG